MFTGFKSILRMPAKNKKLQSDTNGKITKLNF